MTSIPLFAQADAARELLDQTGKRWGNVDTTDTLLVLGFIFLLVVALFCWAYFIRKRPTKQLGSHVLVRPHRHRHSHSHRSHRFSPAESSRRLRMRRRRRRRRREEDLPRNPTLGETGGLPPPRSEEPEVPPAEPSRT